MGNSIEKFKQSEKALCLCLAKIAMRNEIATDDMVTYAHRVMLDLKKSGLDYFNNESPDYVVRSIMAHVGIKIYK